MGTMKKRKILKLPYSPSFSFVFFSFFFFKAKILTTNIETKSLVKDWENSKRWYMLIFCQMSGLCSWILIGMTNLELVGSHIHLVINRNLVDIAIYTKYRHINIKNINRSSKGTCFQNKPQVKAVKHLHQ